VGELHFTGNTFYLFILFICDLFNDLISTSDYITLNDRMISE
jgi:hypothetical protein